MWKDRKELPSLKKLNLKFDVDKLREAVRAVEDKDWNACIGGALNDLREVYGNKLSKIAYNRHNADIDVDDDWKNYSYQQLALTEFNPSYTIREDRNSGTRYDRSFMKGEWFYRAEIHGSKPLDSQTGRPETRTPGGCVVHRGQHRWPKNIRPSD